MGSKIVVIGSYNIDLTMKMKAFPKPGETIIADDFFKTPGGKGANQAIAAARAGGKVTFISKVGNDEYGKQVIKNLRDEKIDVGNMIVDGSSPTGVAMIWVDANGENSIAVASGANGKLTGAEISACEKAIKSADIILVQLEIPLGTVKAVLEMGHRLDKKIILNPAPAFRLSKEYLKKISIITPNISELEAMTGKPAGTFEEISKAAKQLLAAGIEEVIVTGGGNGAYYFRGEEFTHIPAFKVKAVDTTAAGDIFNGALAAAIMEYDEIKDALLFASAAAALSVTVQGAQKSAPLREDILQFLTKKSKLINRTK